MITPVVHRLLVTPLVAVALGLVITTGVSGQHAQCTLRLADLPVSGELVGFRLGMTTDQVKARAPQVVFGRKDDFAVSKTSINPDFDPRIDKSSFPGVRTVSLDFLDDRLTSLWLGYDATFKWQTVDDFVKGISQSLRLPNAWSPWRTRGQRLRCADFELTVSMLGEGPSFRILDLSAEETIAARRQAREDLLAAMEEEQGEEIVADKKLKLFYPGECRPSNAIKESEKVVFKSREEAEKAGFKLAPQCE